MGRNFFDSFVNSALDTYKTVSYERRAREDQERQRRRDAQDDEDRRMKRKAIADTQDIMSGNRKVAVDPASQTISQADMNNLGPGIEIMAPDAPRTSALPLRGPAPGADAFTEADPGRAMGVPLGTHRDMTDGERLRAIGTAIAPLDIGTSLQMQEKAKEADVGVVYREIFGASGSFSSLSALSRRSDLIPDVDFERVKGEDGKPMWQAMIDGKPGKMYRNEQEYVMDLLPMVAEDPAMAMQVYQSMQANNRAERGLAIQEEGLDIQRQSAADAAEARRQSLEFERYKWNAGKELRDASLRFEQTRGAAGAFELEQAKAKQKLFTDIEAALENRDYDTAGRLATSGAMQYGLTKQVTVEDENGREVVQTVNPLLDSVNARRPKELPQAVALEVISELKKEGRTAKRLDPDEQEAAFDKEHGTGAWDMFLRRYPEAQQVLDKYAPEGAAPNAEAPRKAIPDGEPPAAASYTFDRAKGFDGAPADVVQAAQAYAAAKRAYTEIPGLPVGGESGLKAVQRGVQGRETIQAARDVLLQRLQLPTDYRERNAALQAIEALTQ